MFSLFIENKLFSSTLLLYNLDNGPENNQVSLYNTRGNTRESSVRCTLYAHL